MGVPRSLQSGCAAASESIQPQCLCPRAQHRHVDSQRVEWGMLCASLLSIPVPPRSVALPPSRPARRHSPGPCRLPGPFLRYGPGRSRAVAAARRAGPKRRRIITVNFKSCLGVVKRPGRGKCHWHGSDSGPLPHDSFSLPGPAHLARNPAARKVVTPTTEDVRVSRSHAQAPLRRRTMPAAVPPPPLLFNLILASS